MVKSFENEGGVLDKVGSRKIEKKPSVGLVAASSIYSTTIETRKVACHCK
jgi:hypothetical protein